MKLFKTALAVAAIAPALFVATAPARADIRTGRLVCNVAPGYGMVLGSQKALTCRYDTVDGRREFYTGTAGKLGVDVGQTTGGQIVWAVFEPALAAGSLAGNYAGATAEITIGVGLGVNVLIGGGNGGVTLQPLSVGAQTGLNVAAGIGTMSLTQIAPPPRARVYFPKHHGHHRHH